MSDSAADPAHDRASNEPMVPELTEDPSAEASPADAANGQAEPSQEPSTEKDPGEEPKAAAPDNPEPDHEAVGIGVVDAPQVDPETHI